MAVAALEERLIAVYEAVAFGLDMFAAEKAGERVLLAGPVRLDVGFVAADTVVIGRLFTHPRARGHGCASAALRGLCDVSDRVRWTLVVDVDSAVGGDPGRAAQLLARFGFHGPVSAFTRAPRRCWHGTT